MAQLQKKTYPNKKGFCETKTQEKDIHEDIDGSKWDKRAANESLVVVATFIYKLLEAKYWGYAAWGVSKHMYFLRMLYTLS